MYPSVVHTHYRGSRTNISICWFLISTFLSNNRTKNNDQIGVYKFPCNSCPSTYIGETERNLPVRLSEHMRDIRNKKETSGPYIHLRNNPTHHFDVEDALLIDSEKRPQVRKFKEFLYITKSTSYNCNLEFISTLFGLLLF